MFYIQTRFDCEMAVSLFQFLNSLARVVGVLRCLALNRVDVCEELGETRGPKVGLS